MSDSYPAPSLWAWLRGWLVRLWRNLQWRALAWAQMVYLGAVVLVLALTPSSYQAPARQRLAQHMVLCTAPILPGFTLLAALACLVLTHIVIASAHSYGLSRYAHEMLIRVLVLELIPLSAALFVALRCTIPYGQELARLRSQGQFDTLRQQGCDPVRTELLPRVLAGAYASITLAAVVRGGPGHRLLRGVWLAPGGHGQLHTHVWPGLHTRVFLGVWAENRVFQPGGGAGALCIGHAPWARFV